MMRQDQRSLGQGQLMKNNFCDDARSKVIARSADER